MGKFKRRTVKRKSRTRRASTRRFGGSAMNEEESGHPHTRAWNAAHPDPTLSQKAYGAATKHGPRAAFNAGLAAMSYAGHPVEAAAINLVCSPYWNGHVTVGSVLNLLSNTGATELVIANKLVSTLPSAAAAVSWYDKSAQAWAATQTPEIQRKLAALARQLDIAKNQQDKCLPSHPLGHVGPYAKASGLNTTVHGLAGFGQKWR
jgi:hypothetical protein